MELTIDNAAEYVERAVQTLASQPEDPKEGRGIVIAAGGHRYQVNAWVCIRMLRHWGCKLPIQCWYLGPDEYNEEWANLVKPYGVECIDAYVVQLEHHHERLFGWELKPYMIQHSPFAEVLLLDADNVPLVDPEFLFETPEYKKTGAIFWPDFGRLGPDRLAWKVFGNIPYRDEPEFESGQIVVDKLRCWRALELCHWYMQNSNNFFFHHVHGDKEIFHMAWRKLDMPYSMPSRGIDALPGVMCQHDFDGRRIFQHRNLRKWSLHENPRTPGFLYEDLCLKFIEELRDNWYIQHVQPKTDEDKRRMEQLHEKLFQYKRIGHDERPMRLLKNGTFLVGGAGCEHSWAIRDGKMHIHGEDGTLTMILEEQPDGAWTGAWLVHEKMPIRLEPR